MDPHRLAEERSLELHRAVAAILDREPERIRDARQRVRQWLADGTCSEHYASRWARLLDGPYADLRAVLVDAGEEARALRQSTPFSGVVDPRTRWRIWAEVRARWSDAS